MTETDPFAAPTTAPEEAYSRGGADFVPLSEFIGRVLIIVPHLLEKRVKSSFPKKVKNEAGQEIEIEAWSPRLTATIVAVTGDGSFEWKVGPEVKKLNVELPHAFPNQQIWSAPLIDRTEGARLHRDGAVMTLGRLAMKDKAYELRDVGPGPERDAAYAWLKTEAGLELKAQASKLCRVSESAVDIQPAVTSAPAQAATPFG